MDKVIGNPTTTPMAIPDWNQTDSKKSDYIKNKPDLSEYATKEELLPIVNLGEKSDESFLDGIFEKGIYLYKIKVEGSATILKEYYKICIIHKITNQKNASVLQCNQFVFPDKKERTYTNGTKEWTDWEEPYAKKSEIPTVDIELNTESTNAIQNKAVAEAIARIEYLKEITHEEIDTALTSGIYIIDNGKQYLLVSDCRPDDYIYQTLIYGTTISMRVYHHNTWEPWMHLADKYYVDMMGQEIEATIGNIETSLENIIAKYGLGGDSE